MEVLEIADLAVSTGPVCDACLGRLVADRSFGLGNDERGRALRTAAALERDVPYESPEIEECWVCEGRCGEFDRWASRAVESIGDVGFETYQVGTRVPPLLEENDELLRAEAGLEPDAGERLNSEFNREVGKRIGRETGTDVGFTRPDVQFTIDLAEDTIEKAVNSAFVYGRYRKLERGIPQTEWPCSDCDGSGRQGRRPCDTCDGTGYLYPDSVEQLTAPVVRDVMDGTAATFHGAGREDVDARMLETGRPFVIEVEEPHRRSIDTDRLEGDINAFADGRVEVERLQLASYEMVERVKGLDASKRYRADVTFDTPVEPEQLQTAVETLSGATIEQFTPNRVDHRRANLTRERVAYEVTAELDSPDSAVVEIHGQGGLYVKELISGDEGRTEPSLTGLLATDATVTALDVLAVTGEDEPFEIGEYLQQSATQS